MRWSSLRVAVVALALGASNGAQASEVEAGEDSLQGLIEKTVPLRTHSLFPPYVDSDLQNRWWDFGGNAYINTNKHVRLTQDKKSQMGWLWSRLPLTTPNWQMDIEFKVDGESKGMFGDGFAIWFTTDRAKPGPVFGSVDYFKGLGIFFDTYANARHAYQWPRVTAMLGDGKTAYDNDHDNAANELAACSENFRKGDVTTKARITYIKGKMLQLKLHTKRWDEWTTCFEINTQLPDSPYVGFSALTGDVSDAHDIISISTSSATLDPGVHGEQSPFSGDSSNKPNKRGRRSNSGAAAWFLFILKAIGVVAFLAFAFSAYRTYNAQKVDRRQW